MSKLKIINSVTTDALGTIKKVVHDGDIRKIYLTNEKNRSNYHTIIKEIKLNDKYIILSKIEIGDIYNIYYRFDDGGDNVYERKFNKIKKTSEKKELYIKTQKGSITINEYNNEKNLTFKINKNGKSKK